MFSKRVISYAGPDLRWSDVRAVAKSARSGFYENYRREVADLETRLSKLTGRRHAIATSSATSALHLCLEALELPSIAEVITSDASCVASAMPILHARATPVLVDVDPDTLCISPDAIRGAITSETRVILPVHWNGHPADMGEIMKIASKHNLVVIEDGAAALGSLYGGAPIGSFGLASVFSFQGAKIAIGGQGGAILTDDDQFAVKIRELGSFGRTDSKKQYWSDHLGWNYGMASLPAALASSQLDRLEKLIRKKRRIFSLYARELQDVAGISLIREPEYGKSNFSYPIALLTELAQTSRGDLLGELQRRGIDSRPAQPRISKMPMFTEKFSNPVAENVEKNGFILPSAHRLTAADIMRVGKTLRRLI